MRIKKRKINKKTRSAVVKIVKRKRTKSRVLLVVIKTRRARKAVLSAPGIPAKVWTGHDF